MIYLPVWCDQFGPRNSKTIMISLIQLGVPLGVVAGYYLTAWLKNIYGWDLSFIIQGIAVAGLALIIMFIPGTYFSRTLTFKNKNSNNKEIFGDTQSVNDTSSNIKALETGMNVSFGKKMSSRCANIRLILSQKVFLFCTLGLSSLFFIITVVQFWASDYMKDVLKIENERTIDLSFVIVCVTSPTLGVAFGGFTSSKIGGYESKHSILLCLIYAIIASLFAIPIPLVDSILYFTIYLWLVLFFGAAILPPITGIIISSSPIEFRGSANSITGAITTLLGYLPAPFVYSVIYDLSYTYNPRLAITSVMYYSFGGVILLAFATYFRYKNYKRRASSLLSVDDKLKRSDSILTGNVAQVFGVTPTIDNHDSIMNLDEPYSSDSSGNNETDKVNTLENENKTKNIYFSEIDSVYAKQQNSPHFNITDTHNFDHFRDNNNSLITNSKKEESIFGPNNKQSCIEISYEQSGVTNSMKEDKSLLLNTGSLQNQDIIIKSL
jgi:MFS family permease